MKVSLNVKNNDIIQGKYRIESARCTGYNYDAKGYYFFTICTKNRIPYFGSVCNREMKLSAWGRMAWDCWKQIPDHYQGIELGSFVVMPDHIHGIIRLDGIHPEVKNPATPNLANVIGSFKSAVTKTIRESGQPAFQWLLRYHDHIIRDDAERRRIERYIRDNPRWYRDHHL